jgi:hypothetical protein
MQFNYCGLRGGAISGTQSVNFEDVNPGGLAQCRYALRRLRVGALSVQLPGDEVTGPFYVRLGFPPDLHASIQNIPDIPNRVFCFSQTEDKPFAYGLVLPAGEHSLADHAATVLLLGLSTEGIDPHLLPTSEEIALELPIKVLALRPVVAFTPVPSVISEQWLRDSYIAAMCFGAAMLEDT